MKRYAFGNLELGQRTIRDNLTPDGCEEGDIIKYGWPEHGQVRSEVKAAYRA